MVGQWNQAWGALHQQSIDKIIFIVPYSLTKNGILGEKSSGGTVQPSVGCSLPSPDLPAPDSAPVPEHEVISWAGFFTFQPF